MIQTQSSRAYSLKKLNCGRGRYKRKRITMETSQSSIQKKVKGIGVPSGQVGKYDLLRRCKLDVMFLI